LQNSYYPFTQQFGFQGFFASATILRNFKNVFGPIGGFS
jgi:hypothetical protein